LTRHPVAPDLPHQTAQVNKMKYWNNISKRGLNIIGALAVAGLLCVSLYIQFVVRQQPCPLCVIQRAIFIAIGLLFAWSALHNAKKFWTKIYSIFILLFASGGTAVASYQVWLQHLPKDQVPACGPGLDFMLKHFPVSEVLQELLHGSGECAEKGWTFLALSIPEMALIGFVLLGWYAVLIGWRPD
jgi:protein dithiol:quinone oxidoreductase